jgi:hypothetical protein
MKTETSLKCKGCKVNLPTHEYDSVHNRILWYGRYYVNELVEWICADCWEKGIRYKEGSVKYYKEYK